MSLRDQKSFLSNIHPFGFLSSKQLDKCIQHLDIAYYEKDSIIISPENIHDHFFIIIKGCVHEFKDDELIMDYYQEDTFDSNSLIYGKTKSTYKVIEDLITYELEKNTFIELIEENKDFKDYFLNDLVNKLQILKEKEFTSELSTFILDKVKNAIVHNACIVDQDSDLLSAIKKSQEQKTSTIIVKKENLYGIITDSILKNEVLLKNKSLDIKVKEIAIFPVLCIKENDYLFDALSLLIKKNIKRLVVLNDKSEIIGILEQIDVLSHFANHTNVVDTKIKKAKDLEELKQASLDLINIIKSLHAKGVKVSHISNLIGQLNTKVYKKLFELILPSHLQNKSCLIVMGSEGRNEQIIKTDQDNALVIKDKEDVEKFYPYMQKITQALISFGYPPCPGNIMVSNNFWCKTQNDYKNETKKWINFPDIQNYMDLAIFFDSFAVAGDKNLLIELKDDLFKRLHKQDVFMAYFAKSTLAFDTPTTVANFMKKTNYIDIKKAGIFPIVQGIRSLCLRERIRETTTIKRIRILEEKEIIKKTMADELIEAFDVLGTLRLNQHIYLSQNKKEINNEIDTHKLSKIKRELLKDSLKIVINFKKFISYVFRIEKIL